MNTSDTPSAAAAPEMLSTIRALLMARRNVSLRRLAAPGPTQQQLDDLLATAASAPDHGRIRPWRFVVVPPHQSYALAEAFALALTNREASSTHAQLDLARNKAHHAPVLLLAIASLICGDDAVIPDADRLVSLGCAIQDFLLAARAMGCDSGLSSGRSVNSARRRALFALADNELAVCFISLGQQSDRRAGSSRPSESVTANTLLSCVP